MNTPDLYGAWLTAGNNLQHAGTWLADHLAWLTVAALLLTAGITHRIRTRRTLRHGLTRLEQYANHAPSRPILDDFHQPRKEKP